MSSRQWWRSATPSSALPEGTHRLNLADDHLQVTGVPFSIVSNTNVDTSTRSFLDDPADRELRASRIDRELQIPPIYRAPDPPHLQIPPIYGNSREETVEASIVASADFHQWAQLRLTKQYRAASDPEWGEQNRRLGDGTADMLPDHEFNDAAGGKRAVAMPLVTNLFSRGQEEEAVEWLWGRTPDGRLNVHSGFKSVLCAKNVTRDRWNDIVSNMLEAEDPSAPGRLYAAYQEVSLEGGEDADGSQLQRELTPEDMAEIGDADSPETLSLSPHQSADRPP